MSDQTRQTSDGPLSPDALRLLELLADDAFDVLSIAEREEMDGLLRRVPRLTDEHGRVIERGSMDEAIGALIPVLGASNDKMSGTAGVSTGLPAALRDRLVQQGTTVVAAKYPVVSVAPVAGAADSSSGGRQNVIGWVGWFAAAAALALAAVLYQSRNAPAASAAERLAMLLREHPETSKYAWAAQAQGPGVSGEVIWNNQLQQGFMRFKGLAANDPKKEQYQTWIFDGGRPEYPVDGGVFDMATGVRDTNGDLIVPISAKLAVFKPTLFAVTIEKPGGVVVSDKGRLVSIAKVE